MNHLGLSILSLLLLAVGWPSHGQGQAPPTAASLAGDPCRQFDFWVGDWECHTLTGQLAGTNTITSEVGGKALQEHWIGAGGGTGTSLNAYDAARHVWHQTWIDTSGTVLLIEGGLQTDGSMLMEGKKPGPGGAEALHRIRWTPRDDGTVRQTWDMSTDSGKTRRVLADLIYSPREAAPEDDASRNDD